MTTQSKCNEREALVALVYDDCDAAERQRLETHVTTCAACAQEVEELRAAHVAMAAWTMPEPDAPIVDRLGSDVRPWRLVEPEKEESGPAGRGPRRVFSTRWMQVAAAVIVLGVTAAMANVEVEFGSGGVVVRTGWKRSPADAGRTAQTVAAGQPSSSGGSGSSLVRSESPWRADLAGLERRLRTEFSAQAMADASARNPAASNRQGTQTPQTPQT
ncbi:MAG: zf-HC2 domain-containing protein, partial [Acidobacteria bacterium]|nr:zf-HC2 domain-containing protein [Acidobacteriota bacterium]